MPAFYSVYAVIAGVNLNNLKANHNGWSYRLASKTAIIAGINLNDLKANHNYGGSAARPLQAIIAGVNINNLKATCNHFLEVGGEVALAAEVDGFGE